MGAIQNSINNMVGSVAAATSVAKIVKGQAEANRIGQAQLEDSMMKDVESGNINSLISNGFLEGKNAAEDVNNLTKYLSDKTLTENALRESVTAQTDATNASSDFMEFDEKYRAEHPEVADKPFITDKAYEAAEENSILKGVAAQTAAEKANTRLMMFGQEAAAMRNRVRAHIKNIVGGRR